MSKPNLIVPEDCEQPNVLHALTRKRAEVAGKIEHCQLELRRHIGELDHLDATIRLFHPTIDLTAIRSKPVPPRHAAFKGEVTRIVMDTLREATSPVTSKEIAVKLMVARGLDPSERELETLMVKRVCASLRAHRIKGMVRVATSIGGLQGWEIAS